MIIKKDTPVIFLRIPNFERKYNIIDEHIKVLEKKGYVDLMKLGKRPNELRVTDLFKLKGYLILKSASKFGNKFYLCSVEKINEIYDKLKEEILDLGDIDIDVKKIYIAFKGRRNIADVEFYKNHITVFVNVKKGNLEDPLNILSDISNIGHHGNGDYCLDLYKIDDIDKIIPFIKKSYEINKK